MTTVIVPGAPRPVPADPQIRLPAPPVWAGIRYHNWFRKYGTLDNYEAYKRTRIWRAGGSRHGYGDEYRNYVERDPIGTSFTDTFGYLGHLATTWNNNKRIPAGTIIRSNHPDRRQYKGWFEKDIIWDGNKWTYYYDKDSIYQTHRNTDQFDQRDSLMRSSSPWA